MIRSGGGLEYSALKVSLRWPCWQWKGIKTPDDATGEETRHEKGGSAYAASNITEADIRKATSTEATYGAEHADGGRGNDTDDESLGPW